MGPSKAPAQKAESRCRHSHLLSGPQAPIPSKGHINSYPAYLTVNVGLTQDCGVHAASLKEQMAISVEKFLQTVGPFAQMPLGPDPRCQQGA